MSSNAQLVKKLRKLSVTEPIETHDMYLYGMFYHAALAGKKETVEYLLDYGRSGLGDSGSFMRNWMRLLIKSAIRTYHSDIAIRILEDMKDDIDQNVCYDTKQTFLDMAVEYRLKNFIDTLLMGEDLNSFLINLTFPEHRDHLSTEEKDFIKYLMNLGVPLNVSSLTSKSGVHLDIDPINLLNNWKPKLNYDPVSAITCYKHPHRPYPNEEKHILSLLDNPEFYTKLRANRFLLGAVAKRNVLFARKILSKGIHDLEVCLTGLEIACLLNDKEKLSYLLGYKLEFPAKGANASLMTNAARDGYTDLVVKFLDMGCPINIKSRNFLEFDFVTPLIMAAYGGHTETVNTLLERGATVCAESLVACVIKDNEVLLRVLLARGGKAAISSTISSTGWSPLHYACHRSTINIVKLLLSNGANINQLSHFDVSMHLDGYGTYGTTPLSCASKQRRADVVQLLLERGAATQKPFSKEIYINTCPIYHACCLSRAPCITTQETYSHFLPKQIPVIEAFLKFKDRIPADDFCIALHVAASFCNAPLISHLLKVFPREILVRYFENPQKIAMDIECDFIPSTLDLFCLVDAIFDVPSVARLFFKGYQTPMKQWYRENLYLMSHIFQQSCGIINRVPTFYASKMLAGGDIDNLTVYVQCGFNLKDVKFCLKHIQFDQLEDEEGLAEYLESVSSLVKNPLSLKQICRVKVRKVLADTNCPSMKKAIAALELPPLLVDFLKFC